jgi:hypothetical protein
MECSSLPYIHFDLIVNEVIIIIEELSDNGHRCQLTATWVRHWCCHCVKVPNSCFTDQYCTACNGYECLVLFELHSHWKMQEFCHVISLHQSYNWDWWVCYSIVSRCTYSAPSCCYACYVTKVPLWQCCIFYCITTIYLSLWCWCKYCQHKSIRDSH